MIIHFSREYFKKKAQALGRNEALIKQLESYSERLLEKELPVIFSPQHLALLMGQNYDFLNKCLENRKSYYLEFGIKKKSGGIRYIMAPRDEIKMIQYWIKTYILDKLSFPDYVTAYQKGRSIADNAKPHTNKQLIIKFDLKNYFESITESSVYGLFRIIGYNKAVAIELAKACCVQPSIIHRKRLLKANIVPIYYDNEMSSVLPQGAPTSPTLSNLAAFRIDIRLHEYAKKNGYDYTRYADDLTFSGPISSKLKKSVIRDIIEEEHFKLNEKKGSYRLQSSRQIVTGLNVNQGVTIAKKFRKKIFTELHNCLKFGPYVHLRKAGLGHKINYREWLFGNILFIMSVHETEGKKMKEKFEKISWN